MEWEGKVAAPQPLCAATGRPLEPGETVFCTLVLHEGRFERRDIAAEAWPGHGRDGVLSWWKRTVPVPERRPARIRLDPQALGRIFADLAQAADPAQERFRYIVALCLMRARKLTLERVERGADGAVLVLVERGGGRHRLRDPALAAGDEQALTDQLLAVAGEASTPSALDDAHRREVEDAG
jgi:hypothetical protein